MEEASTTVYFDGQFWVAVIERIDGEGGVWVGRHVFGAEPTNNDLRRFYLESYAAVRCLRSPIRIRLKQRRGGREQDRRTSKSKAIYGELQAAASEARKLASREALAAGEEERYRLRREKKKEKHRGH